VELSGTRWKYVESTAIADWPKFGFPLRIADYLAGTDANRYWLYVVPQNPQYVARISGILARG
jgi:hypothetical protein